MILTVTAPVVLAVLVLVVVLAVGCYWLGRVEERQDRQEQGEGEWRPDRW